MRGGGIYKGFLEGKFQGQRLRGLVGVWVLGDRKEGRRDEGFRRINVNCIAIMKGDVSMCVFICSYLYLQKGGDCNI